MVINTDKLEFQRLFGKHVEKLRTERNFSFRQLAQRCDLDYSDINKIEKGEVDLRISTIQELSRGLEISPKELFDFEADLGKG